MLTRRELMTGLAMGTMLLTAQPLLAQDKPFAGVEIKVAMIDEPREWAFRSIPMASTICSTRS
jgi:multiple sugar transport system substrate-binding protein